MPRHHGRSRTNQYGPGGAVKAAPVQMWRPGPDLGADAGTGTAGWLAHAHGSPEAASLEWTERNVAVLPLGTRFDTVRIPVGIIYAALGTRSRTVVGPLLELALHGPVIQDSERWFYPLVPVGGAPDWTAPAGTYLARGWLGVPRPDQLAPPGMYWCVPAREPGRLCDLARVAALVEAGFARSQGEGRSQERAQGDDRSQERSQGDDRSQRDEGPART
ncbi:hypothetical protein [Streptomyces sp. NPDC058657]|uniref:hypothetical protein n=1 Tax=unclassified Streptomyces TaxID=2593676 RepID=UPI003646F24D